MTYKTVDEQNAYQRRYCAEHRDDQKAKILANRRRRLLLETPPERRKRLRKQRQKYAEKRFAERQARSYEQWKEWQASHVHFCDSLPEGRCCKRCHDRDLPGECGMFLVSHMINGDEHHWWVCCARKAANWKRLGYKYGMSLLNACCPGATDHIWEP